MTVQQIEAFKRENELAPEAEGEPVAVGADFDDEIDLRAEDDALIAAELEAEQARAAEKAEAAAAAEPDTDEADDADEGGEDENGGTARRSRRGRRGRGGRRTGARSATALEGTFDHGEEGYGLWLDPAVEDNPIYAEHWAGHRPVEVTIEADRIVIRRTGGDGEDDE